MNVDFLTKYHEQPRREFAQALYTRLDQQKPGLLGRKLTFRNAVIIIALLILVIACVRVLTAPKWVKVGNFWVYVTSHKLFTSGPGDITTLATPVEWPTYSHSDIVDALGNGVKIPTWMPDGFDYDSILGTNGFSPLGGLLWIGTPEERYIMLYIQPTNKPQQTIYSWVAPGSFQEVQVNGLSAILVEGDWEAPPPDFWTRAEQELLTIELDWDDNAAMQLFWVDGAWNYQLIAYYGISIQDLVRIAESSQ